MLSPFLPTIYFPVGHFIDIEYDCLGKHMFYYVFLTVPIRYADKEYTNGDIKERKITIILVQIAFFARFK